MNFLFCAGAIISRTAKINPEKIGTFPPSQNMVLRRVRNNFADNFIASKN